jgi:hypothetical protein
MSETTKAALQAWDEFAMGVGLFAPSLLTMPAFTKVYDAMQDLRAEEGTPLDLEPESAHLNEGMGL